MKPLLIAALLATSACAQKDWQSLSAVGEGFSGRGAYSSEIRRQNRLFRRMESRAVERCFHQNIKTGLTTFC